MIITPKEIYEKLSKGSEKRVELKCDKCGKITSTTYNNYYNSSKRRNTNKTYCLSCSNKIHSSKRKGSTSPLKGIKKPEISGINSKSWKGGQYISSDGYVMEYIGNNQGKSKWSNYRKLHLIIAEKKIGRKLNSGEVVHHINGNKLDNSESNLHILKSESEHRQIHNKLQELCFSLIQKNLISYNEETKTYVAMGKLRELLETLEEDNQQPSLNSNVFEGSETSR